MASAFIALPFSPTPEETTQVLKSYSQVLLVEFANLELDKLLEAKGKPVIYTPLYNMEKFAFLKGYQKALVYKAGPCRLLNPRSAG